jgi:site-specific DNA-methyltransferase (adenine-specific)
MEDLDEIELQLVELEENERRKDLDWRDHVKAIAKIHELYELKAEQAGDPWSRERTAEMLFYSAASISKCLRVFRDLDSPKIANAPGLAAAYNVLSRMDDRAVGDIMSTITSAGRAPAAPKPPTQAEVAEAMASLGVAEPEARAVLKPKALPVPVAQPESILHESFLDWAPRYEGPTFSLVHMDFPYGTNVFAGPQAGGLTHDTYDDDPDVYWELIRCFCKNRDRFMSASAHMMFWFDMDYYEDTLRLFEELAPEISIRRKPLIWHKTCNSGILSDPKRGPRHVYESCLIMSREDRLIVKAKSDTYGCHVDRDLHPSTKPEPMLRHFMEMFVDDHTTMLDPTCGSGASLRAAESLGAKHVLGLEINKEFLDPARQALKQFRAKRAMSKKV